MNKIQAIVLGGGCFWCLEEIFLHTRGIENVISGYAGGSTEYPNYNEVSTGETGYAEVVQVDFDDSQISLEDILRIFFVVHDPTTVNRQGNDVGTQYRSIILYSNEQQRKTAELVRNEITNKKIYKKPIVTEIVPLDKFYVAEDYHQKYFEKNPDQAYCQIVIAPKVLEFRKKYLKFYK